MSDSTLDGYKFGVIYFILQAAPIYICTYYNYVFMGTYHINYTVLLVITCDAYYQCYFPMYTLFQQTGFHL